MREVFFRRWSCGGILGLEEEGGGGGVRPTRRRVWVSGKAADDARNKYDTETLYRVSIHTLYTQPHILTALGVFNIKYTLYSIAYMH